MNKTPSVVASTLEIPLLTTQAYTTSGSLPGRQSVNRAELFAIATVVANTNGGVIVTDSLYALTTVSQILANPNSGKHGDRDNLDIIYALRHACASKPLHGFQLEKIKSHQPQPQDARTKAAFYHEGNRFVDSAAKQTLVNLPDRHLNTLIRDCHVASQVSSATVLFAGLVTSKLYVVQNLMSATRTVQGLVISSFCLHKRLCAWPHTAWLAMLFGFSLGSGQTPVNVLGYHVHFEAEELRPYQLQTATKQRLCYRYNLAQGVA